MDTKELIKKCSSIALEEEEEQRRISGENLRGAKFKLIILMLLEVINYNPTKSSKKIVRY